MNIQTYLQNKAAQLNCNASINEQGTITINYLGRSFTSDEFDILYPVNVLKIDWSGKESKGENPDRSRAFLYNKKSY